MRLGTRWQAGGAPPASVPAALRDEIARVDAALPVGDGPAPMWTLTWLEGRPIAELDIGFEVALAPDGSVTTGTFDPLS